MTHDRISNFHRLFEFSSHPLLSIDPEGCLANFNGAFGELTGLVGSDMLGKPIAELGIFAKSSLSAIDRLVSAARDDSQQITEQVDVIDKNGEAQPAHASSLSVLDGEEVREIVIGIRIDKDEAGRDERVTKEMLRAQYKGMPIPTYSWKYRGDDFVLVDYNDAAIEITDGGIANFVGKTLHEMYGDQPEVIDDFARCLRERTNFRRRMEYYFRTTEQTRYLVVTYAFVPPDLVMIHTEDVTERQKAKLELMESEERYRSLVESAQEAIFTVDRNGTFLFMNDIACQRLNRSREDCVGKTMWDLFPQAIADRQMASIRRVFDSGSGEIVESITEITGKPYHYSTSLEPIRDHKGRIVSVVLIARDVTSIATMRDDLRKERDFIRSLLETANSLIVCLDKDARIVVFNKECERVSGYSRDEVLGENWLEMFLPKGHRHEGLKDFSSWVKEHPRDSDYYGPLITKSGEVRTILWSNSAIFSPDSDDLTAIAVGHDVTERKWMEELQIVLYRIANTVNTTKDLEDLFVTIRRELGSVIDTRNFFIALYDEENDLISTPHIADDKDDFTSFPAGKTMTAYVIRNNEPLLATRDVKRKLIEAGEVETIGASSEVWLGVPLAIGEEVIGAVVVQDYTNPKAYGKKDLEILQFVSGQIALAIERKRAEERAEAAHVELNQIFDAATPMNVIDRDFNMLKINATYEKLFRVKSEEVIGKKCYDMWSGPLCNTPGCPMNRMLRGETHYEYEDYTTLDDGTVVSSVVSALPFHGPDGEILGIVESFTDISYRLKMEEEIRLREQRFRELANLLPQTVYEYDLEGRMIFTNRYGFEATGYSKDDLAEGVNVFDIIASENHAVARERISRLLKGEELGGVEYELVRKDGTRFPAIVYSSRIMRNGKPSGIRGIAIDITERKESERELREAYDELEQERANLFEKNIALRQVLESVSSDREETKRDIGLNLERAVIPIVTRIRSKVGGEFTADIDLLEDSLKEITSRFTRDLEKKHPDLTQREIQITLLIKQGMSTKEIAVRQGLAVTTVQTFRRQIRRKVGIANKKVNLRTYLMSLGDSFLE